jgi:hypothetical protein
MSKNNFQDNLNTDPGQEGGQRVDNNSLVHGQEGGLRASVHGQRVDNAEIVHGQSMDKDEFVYGQGNYLSMDKAAEYTSLSEKTLRRKIREVLVSQGLDWKSSPKEIEERSCKIKKINVKKTILGFSSFDWEVSSIWLDELKGKVVHRQRVDNEDFVHGQSSVATAQFMSNDAPVLVPPSPLKEEVDFMEIDGRRYSKEHLQDILENYKEEKETKKTMMELQKQINVVMAQMGQIQKMMLLKSPRDEKEDNI